MRIFDKQLEPLKELLAKRENLTVHERFLIIHMCLDIVNKKK